MTQRAKERTTKLESETCGRCGGSGKHSFNLRDGDVCYGCGGRGWRYTKRGQAAAHYLDLLRSVPASTLAVGDLIRVDSVTYGGSPYSYFARVVALSWDDQGHIHISTGGTEHSVLITGPEMRIRKGWSGEEKRSQLQKAIDYQATLTMKGIPRKSHAALAQAEGR